MLDVAGILRDVYVSADATDSHVTFAIETLQARRTDTRLPSAL